MSMRQCPDCGEMYSTSYKTCPFCEEDAAYNKPGRKNRSGHRVASRKSPSILGPAMVVVLVLLVGLVIYFFFGSAIRHLFSGDDAAVPAAQTDTAPAGTSETLSLSAASLSLTVGDTQVLTVTGGINCTWQSSDASVVTVDAGSVTAAAPGTAVISATSDTGGTASCTVTVTAAAQPPAQPVQPAAPAANLTLETIYGTKDDISLGVGDTAPMEVIGTNSAVSWSIENTSVATVSADGTVTGVASGKTVLHATVDGTSLECVIRVG